MNGAHLHLLLNHVPLFATLFGLCILLFGFWLRNTTAQYIAMAFFILAALVTIPVMLSGEGAEEIVEHIAKISKRLSKHTRKRRKVQPGLPVA